MGAHRWPGAALAAAIIALLGIGALWSTSDAPSARAGVADGPLRVISTTEILADLVHQVGGDRVQSSSIVPHGGDPHSHEPTPADARRIAQADVTFTNHLLLEEHALIKAVDANARPGTPNVSLAEAAERYGARVIPLVEDLGLDVVWLGLRVRGDGKARGATRTTDVKLAATGFSGPGRMVAYVTSTLGQPQILFDSAPDPETDNEAVLPPAAHTHLNWAFTKPGIYRLRLEGRLPLPSGERRLGNQWFTFAVGVDPKTARPRTTTEILDGGHTDLTIDLDAGEVYAYVAPKEVGGAQRELKGPGVVIDVPTRAATQVPSDARFAFLGRPGARVLQLPQAVLGKHVHGEIDPHLWEDVRNAKAYVELIRDTLVDRDPAGADAYRANATRYLQRLNELDAYVRDRVASIPADARELITTHDAFGYLAAAYGLKVAGFVVPNPAQQPSAEQVQTLTDTIRSLDVPAVFAEPNLVRRATVLRQVARDQGARVCKLYGDAFDRHAQSYEAMMRFNADELARCLGGLA